MLYAVSDLLIREEHYMDCPAIRMCGFLPGMPGAACTEEKGIREREKEL
jgi:hypothetical protein